MISKTSEVREISSYACSLAETDFDNLNVDEKIKACIKAGIFELKSKTELDLKSIDSINFKSDNLLFGFNERYDSNCKTFYTQPNFNFETEVVDSLFESYYNEFGDTSGVSKISVDFEFLGENDKIEYIKTELNRIRNQQFSNIFFEYNFNSKEFMLTNPDGRIKILNDCQRFQYNFLCDKVYYPLIDRSDKVYSYLEEIDNYYTLNWLNYLYHLNLSENSNKTPARNLEINAYEQLYYMNHLGMLATTEVDELTSKKRDKILSKIIMKDPSNIGKYIREIQKPSKDSRREQINKILLFIQNG